LPIAGYRTDGPSPEVSLYDTRRGDDFRQAAAALVAPGGVGSGGKPGGAARPVRVAVPAGVSSGGASASLALGLADADCLAVVALAGAVAEVSGFGTARGVQGDLATLNFLLAACRPKLGSDRAQSQTRWAARAAAELLAAHAPQVLACVGAFRAKSTVAECIAAIEAASPRPT
jgi:hypothetical protein